MSSHTKKKHSPLLLLLAALPLLSFTLPVLLLGALVAPLPRKLLPVNELLARPRVVVPVLALGQRPLVARLRAPLALVLVGLDVVGHGPVVVGRGAARLRLPIPLPAASRRGGAVAAAAVSGPAALVPPVAVVAVAAPRVPKTGVTLAGRWT